MADVEIEVAIEGLKEATEKLAEFAKHGDGVVSALTTGFEVLGVVAVAAIAAIGFKEAIKEASEFQDSVVKVTTALKAAGNFTEANVEHFKHLADELEETSNISEELTLNLSAQATAIGISVDQTEQLIKTSADLAAVTGQDVNSAFSQLEKTLSGELPRGIAKLFPELKNMSAEQLAAGAAAKLLGDRLRGAAEEARNTYSGAITQVGFQTGQFAKAIGAIVVDNPVVITAINALADAIGGVAKVLKENKDGIIEFVNSGLKILADSIFTVVDLAAPFIGALINIGSVIGNVITPFLGPLITGLGLLGTALKELAVFILDLANQAITPLVQGFQILGIGVLSTVKAISSAVSGETAFTNELQKSIDTLTTGFREQAAGNDAATQGVKDTNKAAKEYIDTLLETDKLESKITNNKISAEEERRKAIQKTIDAEKLRIQQSSAGVTSAAASNPFDFRGNQIKLNQFGTEKGVTPEQLAQTQANQQAGAGLGFAAEVLQGAKGATDVITKGIGAAADSLIPGIGGVVGQIASVLAQGPEASKQFVQGFIDSIPTIIQNIVDSIPVIIDTLVERLPVLIERLAGLLPEIAIKFALSLQNQAPVIATRFAIEFIKHIPEIVKSLVDGIVAGIKDAVGSLGGLFGGGGGGGGGVLGSVGSFLGFAEGGQVPGGAPFTDRVPALLTPQENVIGRDLSQKLSAFVDKFSGGGGSQNLTVNLVVDGKNLANVLLDLNQRGFRTA